MSEHAVFLEDGILAMIYEGPKKEAVRDFIFDNHMASAYESFISRLPSRYSLKALKNSHIHVLTYQDLQTAYHKLPQLADAIRLIVEQAYVDLSERFETLITLSAEERYLHLIQTRPKLFEHIPQYLIASYLGVTNVALSRIRKRLSRT